MDFEAIVHLVLPEVKGQGARGEWTKQEVVFEVAGDQFGRKICVGFWNDKAPAAAALRVGERAVVSVNIESRERNGRWFTEARGWRFTVLAPVADAGGYGAPQQQGGYGAPVQQQQYQGYSAPAQAPAQAPAPAPAPADDLPF